MPAQQPAPVILPLMSTHIRLLFFILMIPFSVSITGQTREITGIVTDRNDGLPIAGANLIIIESGAGCVTDSNGRFVLSNISDNELIISVSFVGYSSEEIKIDTSKSKLILRISLTPKDTELKEVVVTGTGTERRITEAPVRTEVISQKKIKELGVADIEEALAALIPSFTYNRSDMGSNLKINGMKNDYILIMIDGKKLNGDIGGQSDLSRISLSQIEQIEVVKGASSTLYGSDAIGGVINIITRRNQYKSEITNNTRVGWYADINQSNSIALKTDKLSSTTTASYRHTDGWQNTRNEWHRNKLYNNSVTRTINNSTNYSVSEKISYQANQKLQLTAKGEFYEKWTSRPMGVPVWRLNDLYYRNQSYEAGANYNINDNGKLTFGATFDQINYYYDYNSREYSDYFDENGNRIVYYTGDRVLQSSQEFVTINMKGVFNIGEHHTLNTGAEYKHENLKAPFRLESDRAAMYSSSIYIQDEWKANEKLIFTAGIRADKYRDVNINITPKLTSLYRAGSWNMRATLAKGFKAPTIKEMYYHYYASFMSTFKAYYGNTALKPQTSYYYSASIEKNHKNYSLNATIYYNQLRDVIALQTIPTSYEDKLALVEQTMKYVNMAKGYSTGFDISGDINLPHRIKLSAAYSYLDAKAQRTDDEAADDFMKYLKVNGTSHHHASVGASWNKTWKSYRLMLALNGRYQSKSYYLTDGDAKSFNVWRLNTTHRIINSKTINMDASVGIDNIFNHIDRTPHGLNKAITSPGTTVFGALNIRIKKN